MQEKQLEKQTVRRFESINVIPFIDIMLVLLAIVLTTATFVVSSKLNIDVPKSSTDEVMNDDKVIEIAIDKDSMMYFDDTKIPPNELEGKLSSIDKMTPINLRIDHNVKFGQFVTVIDTFKQLQLVKFSIITKQK